MEFTGLWGKGTVVASASINRTKLFHIARIHHPVENWVAPHKRNSTDPLSPIRHLSSDKQREHAFSNSKMRSKYSSTSLDPKLLILILTAWFSPFFFCLTFKLLNFFAVILIILHIYYIFLALKVQYCGNALEISFRFCPVCWF